MNRSHYLRESLVVAPYWKVVFILEEIRALIKYCFCDLRKRIQTINFYLAALVDFGFGLRGVIRGDSGLTSLEYSNEARTKKKPILIIKKETRQYVSYNMYYLQLVMCKGSGRSFNFLCLVLFFFNIKTLHQLDKGMERKLQFDVRNWRLTLSSIRDGTSSLRCLIRFFT